MSIFERAVGLDLAGVRPALRTSSLVSCRIQAPCELAGSFVPRTNHKHPAQTAKGLHPGYCKSLRPEP